MPWEELNLHLTEFLSQADPPCLLLDDLQLLSQDSSRHLADWFSEFAGRQRPAAEPERAKRMLLAVRSEAPLLPGTAGDATWESFLCSFAMVQHQAVAPMRLQETHALLNAELARLELQPSPAELTQWAEWLQERAGGNPFITQQVLRAAWDAGRLTPGLKQSPFLHAELALGTRFQHLFRTHPHSRRLAGALHLAGGALPATVLKRLAPASDPASGDALQAWLNAGLLTHSTQDGLVDWAHELLREEELGWLERSEQLELASQLSSLLPNDLKPTRARLLLGAWPLAPERQREHLSALLSATLSQWKEEARPDGELDNFCFRLMEQQDLPWPLREEALRWLCAAETRQSQRPRWLRLLREVDWRALDAFTRRHLTDSLAATLDHCNAMGESMAWLEKLDPVLEPELQASLRLDLALNRLLKNDRRGAAPLVDGTFLRASTQDPTRLAQLALLELFLATDIVADPALWLARLEAFHATQASQLDVWSRDRLILQIVDAASRARDGEAIDRWQERAIASVQAVASHDPPALGRARVARRLMFFGRSHGCIPDLLAAADWYLARGNLRMALPDLDAAATTHYRHGEVADALELLKSVESLLLGANLDFTTAAFRINACAPFLAGGDWQSAQRWLEELDDVVAGHPSLQPFHAYSSLQVMERRGRRGPLGEEGDRLFRHLVAGQLAISAEGGQRHAELLALSWVQDARAGRPGPSPQRMRDGLKALEGHNINPRPDSLSQLAEAALLFSQGRDGGEWQELAQELSLRLEACETSPSVVLRHAQLARLAHMRGNRVDMRDKVLRAALEAWQCHLPQWLSELAAHFPKVRLEGLVADRSRDRMSIQARREWLNLLEQQAQPGPRFRAFGIDLSVHDPRQLLMTQLERIARDLPRWQRECPAEQGQELNQLEQTALGLQARLPELPDHRGGRDEAVGLSVHLAGELRVWLGGVELPSDRLGGGKFRELFVFLVLERWRHPGRPWSPRDLVRRLWGRSGDTARQLNSLYVYISQLKGLLRQSAFPNCLERSEGGYCLHRDCPVHLDLQDFEVELERDLSVLDHPGDHKGRQRLMEALSHCSHVLDPTLHGHWLDELRAWHEQRWFSLMDCLLATAPKASERKALIKLRQAFFPD